MANRRDSIESAVAGLFVLWLAWISWEVVRNDVDEKIHVVAIDLVRAIGATNGILNTEIETSKINDDRAFGWLKFVNDTALENKGRLIELEVKERLHTHGGN